MRLLLLFLLLSCTKIEYRDIERPVSTDIIINKDTVINNTWIIPSNTVVRFETGGHISGTGTIQDGIIDAGLTQNIFDTSINLVEISLYNKDFSVMWYGANSGNVDNYWNIQKSINTCISNRLPCFVPKGVYRYSKGLQISSIYKNNYVGVALHFYGEGSYWDDKSTLVLTSPSLFGLSLQVGKGTEIDHLRIVGLFNSPITEGATYYNTPLSEYGTPELSYGIVVDLDGTKNVGGSTGCKFHDLWVTNFQILYSVSASGVTYNGDNLVFENIRMGDGRIGFQSNQAQEKGNIIRNIYSWGSIHTLLQIGQSGKYQAGNYHLDGGNIAGKCIRLLDIRESGWYPSFISNLFCESLGSIGSIQCGDSKNQLPTSVSDCIFHFAPISSIGVQNLLYCNSTSIKFDNCLFRYYGDYVSHLKMSGWATFENCSFSGVIDNVYNGFIFK